jgi:hypothetical protein
MPSWQQMSVSCLGLSFSTISFEKYVFGAAQETRLFSELQAAQADLNSVIAAKVVSSAVIRIFTLREKQSREKDNLGLAVAQLDEESQKYHLQTTASVNNGGKKQGISAIAQFVEEEQQRIARKRELKAEAEGRMKQIHVNVKDAGAELSRPNLKTAENRAAELALEVAALELAEADLGRYHNALDAALMRYHQLKVVEINNSLRDLWTATYRGQDIEAIEVRHLC